MLITNITGILAREQGRLIALEVFPTCLRRLKSMLGLYGVVALHSFVDGGGL